jgi:hypothetical protein
MESTEITPTNSALFPPKFRIFSGSALKLLAVCSMLIDHIGSVLLRSLDWAQQDLISLGSYGVSLYALSRYIGRIAFPLYCFLLTEGYVHTHDHRKYGQNLLIFAVLSEIPWNLEHAGVWHYASQNVFFTLFLGFLGIYVIEHYQDTARLLRLLILLLASILLRADYGCSGFGFILMMYIFRKEKVFQAILGSCFLSSRWVAGLAFIPINMYNGKRGFIHGKAAKYCFYAFYPVHLMVLYWIKKATIGY